MKISATICKKLPIHGTQFSSQQYGAGLEMEVPDGLRPDELYGEMRRLYAIMEQSVEGQIAAATAAKANGNGNGNGKGSGNGNGKAPTVAASPAQPTTAPNGSGAIRFIPATAAQQRAVHAICRELGIEVGAVLAENGVAGMDKLGLKQASQIIDKLKARKGR